jgi:choline dehydrogenase
MKMLDHPTLTWGYHAEPDPGTAGRAILYPRGRVLGGSSSINGLIYVRGQPEDFDHWAQLGNRGWGWDDVLPYFRQAENWEGDETEVRGKGGPLFTSKMDRSPLCAAVIEAGREIGLEYREDVNDLPAGAGDSIGWCQQTRGGRWRGSTARTYLRPATKRPNLEVVVKAQVNRILFDGARAVGVEYERGGAVQRADAAREVILSAGAVNSPHILQLSGVGAPEHLSRVGIPVHHASPGLGQNLQDHYIVRISYPVSGMPTVNERSRGVALAGEILRYLVRQGHSNLQRLIGRGLGQGAGGIGDPGRAVQHRTGQLQGRSDRRARRFSRHHRRGLADAAIIARLCRGQIQ